MSIGGIQIPPEVMSALVALLGAILAWVLRMITTKLNGIDNKITGLVNGTLEQAIKEIMDLKPGGQRKTDPPAPTISTTTTILGEKVPPLL